MNQSELVRFHQQAGERICAPAKLNESDLQHAEEETRKAVEKLRANENEAHVAHLQSLKSTLATIREGGAARLKAEEDAAKVSACTLAHPST